MVEDGRVRSLMTPPRTELTGALTVAEYRALLVARAARDAPGGSEGGGSEAGGSEDPAGG